MEALAVIDILRRAGIEVETVSITGNEQVCSAQNITVKADTLFKAQPVCKEDVLFLPGGPGHKQYNECKPLLKLLEKHHAEGGRIAAICAAPSILGHLGILNGKKATAFPGFEKDLTGAEVLTAPVKVVTDGNITTARGMGASIELGLELVRLLISEEKAQEIGQSVQYLEKAGIRIMENEYLDSYERAKRADRERRSHARQMKRRRQKRLKMIKGAITAAVAVVVAVCCILYTTRGEGGGQADGINSQQMAQDAMQALAQISEPEQKFKYPSVSENYKEIVSEEVKVRMLHYST